MRAEIVSVGTELLLGQIVDTNAAWLAERLAPLGIDVYWISQVGDNLGRLVEVVRRAWERSDLTIATGGLGPTEDDLTREAIAALLGEDMRVVPELEAELRGFFTRRGLPMPERNVKQATLVPSARVLHNPIGTAPGWWVEREGRVIVAMPGVPHEMRRMWQEEVMPHLRQRMGSAAIVSRTLKVLGPGESAVEEMVRHLIASANPTLATYAKPDGVYVRVTAKAASDGDAWER
ncbi:MAG: CinA family nicotinamide mononucleotide deamidase-related protein, partial [Chloroflexi bacterium]|nr:CinA family nicotinamide mononucleotide deamidase-related protein [Chloroflexota bacterium]